MQVYDSRPDNIDASMYQVFLGYFINPISASSNVSAKLMDFTQDNDFSFYYVIPFNNSYLVLENS